MDVPPELEREYALRSDLMNCLVRHMAMSYEQAIATTHPLCGFAFRREWANALRAKHGTEEAIRSRHERTVHASTV